MKIYASHPAEAMELVSDWQRKFQSRRKDIQIINPFDLLGEDDRDFVRRRVAGEHLPLSSEYCEKVVRTNLEAIAGSDATISFHTQQNTIGSEMERIYALLFGKKPAIDIFTNSKNIYQVHPWLRWHSDEVCPSPEIFEEQLDSFMEKSRADIPLHADGARNFLRNLAAMKRPNIEEKFCFYLAHATRNRKKVQEFELAFEQRNPKISLINPFTELPRGDLDELIIAKMDAGDLTGYPKNFDRDLVVKDVEAMATRCNGLLAVIQDYTIGGDQELVYANLLGLNPIIAICSTNMIDHPWIKVHTDYRFSSEKEFEAAVPEIISRVRHGERNYRLENYASRIKDLAETA